MAKIPENIDELALLRGSDYVINEHITIHHPTLAEIYDWGEREYFRTVTTICSTPADLKVQLDDLDIDYTKISDFQLFMLLSKELQPEHTRILFGDLDFTQFTTAQNPANEEIVLCDFQHDILIDRLLYTMITDYLRCVHSLTKNEQKPGNEITRKVMIQEERLEQERHQDQGYSSVLAPTISALVNCAEFKYDYDSVWQLPYYALMDAVKRIQAIKSHHHLMGGIYAGMVDTKKLSKSEKESLDWLRRL